MRLRVHRPDSHFQPYQPYPGKAESRARARTLKAPTCRGAKAPCASTARGQLQTQQPRRDLRPARLAVPPERRSLSLFSQLRLVHG